MWIEIFVLEQKEINSPTYMRGYRAVGVLVYTWEDNIKMEIEYMSFATIVLAEINPKNITL
jgi:hypothetical protein